MATSAERRREDRFFLLFAIFVGVFSALAVVCFRVAIEWSRIWLLGAALRPEPWRVLLVPTVVGLLVGALVHTVFPAARSSGVNQTKAALYVYDGYIALRSVVGKFVTSALAIGSGHALGPEDPALHIGAGLASGVARRLKIERRRLRLIPSLGAAAGLAAAFNSPIAAVLFVIEEVIGQWSVGVLGAVILAAVSGVSVAHFFLGSEPLFRVPMVEAARPAELLAYAALGVVGGLAAVAFLKIVLFARPRLRALPGWTRVVQPALAGFLIGCMAVYYPEILGAGYHVIDQCIHGQIAWRVLAVLAVLKILGTALSFSTGTPGGLFAPTLFIGAMLGGAVGGAQAEFFPELRGGPVAVYALVGMGTLFAGNLRSPMTSVFMILEITGNYEIVVPVMLSNTIAYLVSHAFQPAAIFDVLARQDGMDLPSMEEDRERTVLRVEDAMRPYEGAVLKPGETVDAALARVTDRDAEFLLLQQGGGLWSGLRRERLRRAQEEGQGALAVAGLAEASLPALHPDHQLEAALRLVREWWPVMPVVHRANEDHLVGVLSLEDVLRTYGRTDV
jgi:CIC family chloride channel protein